MTRKLFALALMCVGCGGAAEESAPDFACGYTDTAPMVSEYGEPLGTCGPAPMELLSLPDGLRSCQMRREQSADACVSTLAYECLTVDGQGTQAWVEETMQVSPRLWKLRSTLKLHHPSYPGGFCWGEYNGVSWPAY